MPNIINEISKVKYIKNVVIGLDKASKDEFKKAKLFFSKLPQQHEILWHDGPNLKKLDKQLKNIIWHLNKWVRVEMYGIVWGIFYP